MGLLGTLVPDWKYIFEKHLYSSVIMRSLVHIVVKNCSKKELVSMSDLYQMSSADVSLGTALKWSNLCDSGRQLHRRVTAVSTAADVS